jgi:aminocarboxymuconate-semialdehyde decarboxylase
MIDGRVIDVHAHVFPRSAVAMSGTGREWHGSIVERDGDGAPVTITGDRRQVYGSSLHYEPRERRVELMDETGVDVAFLSAIPPLYRYELPPEVGLAAARAINDDIAEWTRLWPDRFAGLAMLPLQDPDASIRELERAMDELGLIGALIGTSVRDANLDDPRLFPVFEAMANRRAFVLCHPATPRGGKAMGSYFLRNLVGNQWETAIAMGSLFFGGVLERLPDLAICFSHGGGYGPFALGRFSHGFRSRPEPRVIATVPPAELMRRIYVDSLVHDENALRYLVDTVGLDHVLLGSDFPSDMGPTQLVAEVAESPRLDDSEKRAILGGNAERLLSELGRPLAATGSAASAPNA